MRVVLISGSGNLDGQTSRSLDALLEGIRAGGGDGEILFLPRFNIARCQRCDRQGDSPCRQQGRCSLQDDFASLVEMLRQSDAAVFATPVYFGGSAAVLRAFLHRLENICKHPDGRRAIAGMPAVGVCIGGGAANCVKKLRNTLSAGIN